jgi:biopolymer transport protein ExbB
MQTGTTVTHFAGLLIRCLTALEQSAEDIEKPIVFYCSKENVGPSWPRWKAEMTVKNKNTVRAQRTAPSTPIRQARSVRFLFLAILAAGALTAAMPAAYAQNTPSVSQPAPAAATPSAPAPPAAAQPTATAPDTAAPTVAPAAPPSAASPALDAQPGQLSIGRAQLPQDLSPWGMFLNADIVVKLVMMGLAFASLVTWTVYIAKAFELAAARRQIRRGLRILSKAATLAQAHDQLREQDGTAAQLMQAAAQEIRLSANARGDGLKERIAWQLERMEMAASRKISRGTGVLATIGSTAPFVGLFGTVWGIMDSFIGISNAHTTNLAVVAPGIAQALLATALGLVAAIPAVMIYNVLARSTAHYRALLGDASALVMRLVSRDLDRAKLPLAQAAE